MEKKRLIGVLLVFCLGIAQRTNARDDKSANPDAALRAHALQGVRATYCSAPHLPNGRADVQRLVKELDDVHANTYSFCIHTPPGRIGTICSCFCPWPRNMEYVSGRPLCRRPNPRRTPGPTPSRSSLTIIDEAVEFARLSLRETNLVAWSIDDFSHNYKFYTPEYVAKMLSAAREINPRLAFAPCCYFQGVTPQFVKNYEPLLDGILFPYRHQSGGANLKDPDLVVPEIQKIKLLTGASFPVVLDVYASAHSSLGKSTPQYVRDVMTAGKTCADGVMVYRHQDPVTNAEKYQIVKELFTAWSATDEKAKR